ncbi:hypothetical protein PUNSTDRAFT_132331 [Punctularia strigosozonata HHB-11173 SS5]|uniref:uncharacterized protein n=1 Tax=Punctularia strigosozonata (strain HHB-11173) TaxID=741275 RepID=UPI00044176F4|nr:uncharacterized protein PUNSTDRAFT_132331 [Punctularia strigosozonata HHB-11173 SS5]EIN10236.1 hypothetical protein PUNSTDRAFT_132331 [Punctularia strigosozonata HHB-11173 SS5]
MCIGRSSDTIKKKMLDMMAYHEGSSERVSRDVQALLDGEKGASFGAILDKALSQRDAARNKSDKHKAKLRKKNAEDIEGGTRIRSEAMQTLKRPRTDTDEASRDSDSSGDDAAQHTEDEAPADVSGSQSRPSKRQRVAQQHQNDNDSCDMDARITRHYDRLEAHCARLEEHQDAVVSQLCRMVDVYDHGISTIVSAIDNLVASQAPSPAQISDNSSESPKHHSAFYDNDEHEI